MLRWRHMIAGYNEGLYRDYADKNSQAFKREMQTFFGEYIKLEQLKERFEEQYGGTFDMSGRYWAHGGFRASASQGKIPLCDKATNEHVAWIEDTNIFRDAHPEGVFLGHRGGRWRVTSYKGSWSEAVNAPAGSDFVLAKWLKGIKLVYVRPEPENIATRGEWTDDHQLFEAQHEMQEGTSPAKGKFVFGIWDFSRKWNGYTKINLGTGARERVSLSQVTSRFRQAVDDGEDFPFLHQLTYRTFGWQWEFGALPESETLKDPESELADVVKGLLEQFIVSRLECNRGDVTVDLDGAENALSMFDCTPGGNGLSMSALVDNRMSGALDECCATLDRLISGKGGLKFHDYVAQLLNLEVSCKPKEVRDVIDAIRKRWNG
jgi:hypothetical protein